jgi:hypothetical protein
MATAVTCIVDTGGTGDYTSTASAAADTFSVGTGGGHANGGLTDADMVANDETLTVTQKSTDNNAETAAMNVTGFTADATRTITFTVDSASRHVGQYSTSKWRFEPTSLADCIIDVDYAVIDGWQVDYNVGGSTADVAVDWKGEGGTIKNMVMRKSGASTGEIKAIYVRGQLAGTTTLFNCLIYDYAANGNAKAIHRAEGVSAADTLNIFNCTIDNCYRGVERDSGTVNVNNNIVINCSNDDFNGTFGASSDNNAYDGTGCGQGSSNVDLSATAETDIFEDWSAKDYRLVQNTGTAAGDSPCYRTGANLYASGVETDIIGAARSASINFDIGAFQTQTVTRSIVIDTGGTGDYSSLSSAYASNFGAGGTALTTFDEKVVLAFQCTDGNADTTAVQVDKFTTDATHTIYGEVDASYRHTGSVPGSGDIYRLVSGGVVLDIRDDNITLVGLAVAADAAGIVHIVQVKSGDVIIDGFAVTDIGGQASQRYGIYANAGTGDITVRNCVAYGLDNTTSSAGFRMNANSGTVIWENNTAEECYFGFISTSTAADYAYNNIAFNCTDCFSGTLAGATNNAYSEGADPGTGGVDISGSSEADVFVGGGNYALKVNTGIASSDSPCYRTGANRYANGVEKDILGNARSASITFDIGAFQTQTVSREITVDPGGTGDYLDLQIAHDADFGCSGQDLVVQDETVKVLAICTNGVAFDNLVTDAGWNCDATHRIWVDVPTAYRMGANWKDGNYARIEKTTDACIVAQETNMKISGLAAELTVTAGFPSVCAMFGSDWEVEDLLLVAKNPSVGSEIYGLQTKVLGTCYAKNIGISIGAGATVNKYGIYENPTGGGTAYYYNCASTGSKWGHYIRSGNTTVVKDNVHFASTADYAGANPDAASEYNAYTVAAAATGSNWVDYSGVAVGSYFEDWANGDMRLAYGETVNRDGKNLYADAALAVTTDLAGTARLNTGLFVIGPSETGAPTPPVLDETREGLGHWPARNTKVGPWALRDDYVGWALGQMTDPRRGAGA